MLHVKVHQEALHALLAAAGRAIAANPQMPVLSAALLSASDASLTATGYDMRAGIRTASTALVDAPGEVLAPYRLLSELVAKLPPVEVELTVSADASTLALHCGGSEYAIPLDADQSPADYPALPDAGSGANAITVDVAELLHAVKRVSAAVPRSDADARMPELHGIGIKLMDSMLRLTGGDGAQFLISSITADARPDTTIDIVLPIESARDLSVIAGAAAYANLWVSDGRLHVTAGETQYSANILTNPYPAIEKALPTEFKHQWRVERDLLKGALDRLMVFSTLGAESVRLDAQDGKLDLTLSGATGSEFVPAESDDASTLAIGFSTRRLLEVVRSTSGKMVTFEANDPNTIAYWHGENVADQAYLMPCVTK